MKNYDTLIPRVGGFYWVDNDRFSTQIDAIAEYEARLASRTGEKAPQDDEITKEDAEVAKPAKKAKKA